MVHVCSGLHHEPGLSVLSSPIDHTFSCTFPTAAVASTSKASDDSQCDKAQPGTLHGSIRTPTGKLKSLIFMYAIYRASDRVRQKMGNSAAFSMEILRQERSIMRQIMRFFLKLI